MLFFGEKLVNDAEKGRIEDALGHFREALAKAYQVGQKDLVVHEEALGQLLNDVVGEVYQKVLENSDFHLVLFENEAVRAVVEWKAEDGQNDGQHADQPPAQRVVHVQRNRAQHALEDLVEHELLKEHHTQLARAHDFLGRVQVLEETPDRHDRLEERVQLGRVPVDVEALDVLADHFQVGELVLQEVHEEVRLVPVGLDGQIHRLQHRAQQLGSVRQVAQKQVGQAQEVRRVRPRQHVFFQHEVQGAGRRVADGPVLEPLEATQRAVVSAQ